MEGLRLETSKEEITCDLDVNRRIMLKLILEKEYAMLNCK
jgi:hypothetical protein